MMIYAIVTPFIQPIIVVISFLMLLATYRDLFPIQDKHYLFIMLICLSIFIATFHIIGAIPLFLFLLLILANRMILYSGLPQASVMRWNWLGLLFIGIISVSIIIHQLQVGWYDMLVADYARIYWMLIAFNMMLFFLIASGTIFVQFGEGRQITASVWGAMVGVSMMFGFWCGNLMYGEAQQMVCTSLTVIPIWFMLSRKKHHHI